MKKFKALKLKLKIKFLQAIADLIYFYCQNSFTKKQFEVGYFYGMTLDYYCTLRDIYLD
jgi:hypothetical protein